MDAGDILDRSQLALSQPSIQEASRKPRLEDARRPEEHFEEPGELLVAVLSDLDEPQGKKNFVLLEKASGDILTRSIEELRHQHLQSGLVIRPGHLTQLLVPLDDREQDLHEVLQRVLVQEVNG